MYMDGLGITKTQLRQRLLRARRINANLRRRVVAAAKKPPTKNVPGTGGSATLPGSSTYVTTSGGTGGTGGGLPFDPKLLLIGAAGIAALMFLRRRSA